MAYSALIQAAAAKFGVPPNLLTAQMMAESGGNPNAVSPAGARGVMQFMPQTAQQFGVNPNDPAQAIPAAAHYDAQNLQRFGNAQGMLAAYNEGPTAYAQHGIDNPQTAAYVQKVMAPQAPSAAAVQAKINEIMGTTGASAAPAAVAPSGPPSPEAVQARINQIMNGTLAPAKSATPPQPGLMHSLGAGLAQGFHDVTNFPALEATKGLAAIGVPLEASPSQVQAMQKQGTAHFDKAYQGNVGADVGRIGGQLASTLPLFGIGGGAIDAAGEGAASLLGDSTTAAKVVRGISNLMTGSAGAGKEGVAGLSTRAASRGIAGAGMGGIAAGVTSGAYPGNPWEQVAGGMAGGALMGEAIPAAGALIKPAVRLAKNSLGGVADLSDKATANGALNSLIKAIKDDGYKDPLGFLDKMREMGPETMPVDVGGRNVRGLAQAVAHAPGAGSEIISSALENRMAENPDRVSAALQQATGKSGNIYGTIEQLEKKARSAAAPLYKASNAFQLPVDEHLQYMLSQPEAKAGFNAGMSADRVNAAAENQPFNPAEYTGSPAIVKPPSSVSLEPTVTPAVAPSMKAVDATKRGLDSLLEPYRNPVTGKLELHGEGVAINNLRSALVKRADELNPAYAEARQAWAGPAQAKDMMFLGQRAINAPHEITAKTVQGLSGVNREYFLNGVTRALQDKIDTTSEGADAVRKIFANPKQQNVLRAAFDDPKTYDEFAHRMKAESAYAKARNEILKGSQTASREAWQANQGVPNMLPHLANALTGNPGAAVMGAARDVNNFLATPTERRLAAQASLLTSTDADTLESMFRSAKSGAVKKTVNNALTGASLAGRGAGGLYGANYGDR